MLHGQTHYENIQKNFIVFKHAKHTILWNASCKLFHEACQAFNFKKHARYSICLKHAMHAVL